MCHQHQAQLLQQHCIAKAKRMLELVMLLCICMCHVLHAQCTYRSPACNHRQYCTATYATRAFMVCCLRFEFLIYQHSIHPRQTAQTLCIASLTPMDFPKAAHIDTGLRQGRAAPAGLTHQPFGVGQGIAPPKYGCLSMAGAGIQAPLLHQYATPVTLLPPSIAQAAPGHLPSSQSGQVNKVSKQLSINVRIMPDSTSCRHSIDIRYSAEAHQ